MKLWGQLRLGEVKWRNFLHSPKRAEFFHDSVLFAQKATSFPFQGGAGASLPFKSQFKHNKPFMMFSPLDRISSPPPLCPPMFCMYFPSL